MLVLLCFLLGGTVFIVYKKDVASFPRFTWPKTTLQLGTEHGLTSEFGMGSGGTRVL